MALDGVPVWEFNSLQLSAMYLVHSRKKAAEDLKTLALISASSGNAEYALECYLKMQEMLYPEIAAEKNRFAAEAEAKFKKLASKFSPKKD